MWCYNWRRSLSRYSLFGTHAWILLFKSYNKKFKCRSTRAAIAHSSVGYRRVERVMFLFTDNSSVYQVFSLQTIWNEKDKWHEFGRNYVRAKEGRHKHSYDQWVKWRKRFLRILQLTGLIFIQISFCFKRIFSSGLALNTSHRARCEKGICWCEVNFLKKRYENQESWCSLGGYGAMHANGLSAIKNGIVIFGRSYFSLAISFSLTFDAVLCAFIIHSLAYFVGWGRYGLTKTALGKTRTLELRTTTHLYLLLKPIFACHKRFRY